MKRAHYSVLICFCSMTYVTGLKAQADYYFDKGFKAESAGEYAEAHVFYSLAIDADPNNEIYYIARGDLVSNLRTDNKTINQKVNYSAFEKAKKDYNRALQLQPESYMAYMSRGTLFYNYYEFDKAKADFDKAIKNAYYLKDMVYARGARGSVKFKMNEVDGALFDLEEALKLDTINSYLLNELGFVYLQVGDYKTARSYYQRILQHHPDNIVAFANTGFTHLRAGEYRQALAIYNDAITQKPEKGFLYSNRALTYYHMGKTEKALVDINHSLQIYPSNSYALYVRAMIYLSIGEKDLACEDLFQARDLGYTLEYGQEVLDLLMQHCLEVNKRKGKGD